MNCYKLNANLLALGCLIAMGWSQHAVAAASTPQRTQPNILFIPVDDLKPMLGCYGDKTIKTPHIDRLAARGMVFLNNHCQQAVCGPTRASLMTGLYPDTTRVYDLATRMRDMNPDILSTPQYFRLMGYETTGVGKTYDSRCVDKKLDEPSWSIPYSQGGENTVYAKESGMPVYGYQNPATKRLNEKATSLAAEEKKKSNGRSENEIFQSIPGSRPPYECMEVPDNAYPDGAVTLGILKVMEKLAAGKKPFFLSVGYQKPHLPFVAPKKYWDMYDPEKLPLAEFRQMPENAPELGYQPGWELRNMYSDVPDDKVLPEKLQRTLIHGYHASVSYTDAQIGILLDKLDELGIADKTIICLWGDHGWHLGDHNIWCKHTNFEQATRAPLIIVAPKAKNAGKKTAAPTEFVDVFPTLCELAGLKVPGHLSGKSLVPLMEGTGDKVKDFALSQYYRVYQGANYMGYALRDERYRYVAWYKIKDSAAWQNKKRDFGMEETPAFTELYDYETDPLEARSLAGAPEQSKRVANYERLLQQKIKDIAACKVNSK